MNNNPFIAYLNRYTTVSPEHEAAFDEFITGIMPPSGQPLRIETKIEGFLQELFAQEKSPSIILTGNAGDGKTYLCRQIAIALNGGLPKDWDEKPISVLTRPSCKLYIIKDLSEMGEENAANLFREWAKSFQGEKLVFILAANEGRLRAILAADEFQELRREIENQLWGGSDPRNEKLIVVNLNKITTSTFVHPTIEWLTSSEHWQACEGCSAYDSCPIRFNAVHLSLPYVAERFRRLYQLLEHIDVHVTLRDMLIHLTYAVTGGIGCQWVNNQKRQDKRHWAEEAYRYVYYENVWGEKADENFRRKATVIRHFRRLNVGNSSIFAVDNFIIDGQPENVSKQAIYERLFAPGLDFGDKIFQQERMSYLQGGATSPQFELQHPLMEWLPHCRRKLFFEWDEVEIADRLFPFTFLREYFRLLKGDQADLYRAKQGLILGLNRAFSGLFLTESDYLFITSQYAHAIEQPVPIVQVRIPTDNIILRTKNDLSNIFDRDFTSLELEIHPPMRVQAEPISWPINLLQFEYLMRRGKGGTPDVLSYECELFIRKFKDDLLSRFATENEKKRIDFFAAERNRYQLRTLWIDDTNRIRIGGD